MIVEDYLEGHGLEQIEWPAHSPNLDPLVPIWNYLDRQVVSLSPLIMSLDELEQGLLLATHFDVQQLDSIENRYCQCVQVRNSHNPY